MQTRNVKLRGLENVEMYLLSAQATLEADISGALRDSPNMKIIQEVHTRVEVLRIAAEQLILLEEKRINKDIADKAKEKKVE